MHPGQLACRGCAVSRTMQGAQRLASPARAHARRWDYGYQTTAMANRTVIVDNNTWNNTHIATVGLAMSSPEEKAWQIYRSLDVNYVFVVFGGFIGCAPRGARAAGEARGRRGQSALRAAPLRLCSGSVSASVSVTHRNVWTDMPAPDTACECMR